MNTSLIAMIVALLMTLGLVITLGAVSLLTGGAFFLFGKPRLTFLKSQHGRKGFAFAFRWNQAREAVKFDQIKVRLFNPFGSPTQVEVAQLIPAKSDSFAEDIEFGDALESLIQAKGLERATVQVEVSSTKDGITHQFDMKGSQFLSKLSGATDTLEEFNSKLPENKNKKVYTEVKRTFIAEPMPKNNVALKVAVNPEFAGEFAAGGAGAASADAPAQENYNVSKVWIEPGCIVCNACEDIFPEVFEVTADTCLVRDGYPMDDGLKVQEAAEACPVEVIKFTKAS